MKCNTQIRDNEQVVTCKNCNGCQRQTVINAMLAYIGSYQHQSSTLQLKIAVLSYFDDQNIDCAKKTLLEAILPLGLDIGDAHKDRQNSSTRSAKEAAVEDVINIFKALDRAGDELEKPIFVIDDVSKLPPVAPEAVGSRMTLLEQMAKQEREIQTIYQMLQGMQKNITDNSSQITNLKETPVNSYAAIARNTNRPASMTATAGPAARSSASNVTTSDVANALTLINKTGDNTDGFVPAGPRPNRQRKLNKSAAGKADAGEELKGGSDVFHMQITNVHQSITDEKIKAYVRNNDTYVQLQKIEDASSPEWETKRFILTFKAEDKETVLQEDFWPTKIFYRQWFIRKKVAAPSENAFQ